MQSQSRLFEDMAKLAGGALSTAAGVRREIETLVRQQIERLLTRMDLVTREEFDAVQAMAAKAREENEALAKRIDALEAKAAGGTKKRATPSNKKA